MAVSLQQKTLIVSGISVVAAHGNCASTDEIKLLESWLNYFKFRADAPYVYATRWALPGSLSIYLPKATVLCQETRAVRENKLISSHWFTKHLKQCYTQKSGRLLWVPTDEKDSSR